MTIFERRKRLLNKAYINQDPGEVEKALSHEFSKNDDCGELLISLLECDWHIRHEDIARALQRLRDPQAIPVLRKVAEMKFEYLNYDNSEALARKCTWALADIGTDEAKIALEELSTISDEVVAGYAKKRLFNWAKELGRKGE